MLKRVLILGGTAEARALARMLIAETDVEAIVSLAGRTAAPADHGCALRVGGFGGAAGLAAYLADERIDALVDATHPFAEQMPRNAESAAARSGVPLLRVERPAWSAEPGEAWIETTSLAEAAATPPSGSRLFLAIGPESAAPFASRGDVWCALRRLEPTDLPFPLPQGRWVIGRPPFSEEAERALFRALRIDMLVVKNSGGDRAKLGAARSLGLEVVMVARPARRDGAARVETAAAALAWLRRRGG